LQEIIRTRLTSFQRIEVTNNLIGDGNVLDKVLLSDAEKIRRTMEEIDHTSFEAAIDRIVHAKTIYIIGVRSSSSLAGFLNFNFRMIFDNVKFVQTTSGSEMFEQIMQLGEGDVMIAISFPRYSKRIINAVEYARSRNANVVALTDSKLSPIASFANQLLIAQSDMASFVDSLVAPLSIINAMIVAVARKKQDEVSERLRALEDVWDRYDVYDKKGG
jgi:DNA-binding MurR/RpiR family transcriptional regulator